jgi:hypothetical protein
MKVNVTMLTLWQSKQKFIFILFYFYLFIIYMFVYLFILPNQPNAFKTYITVQSFIFRTCLRTTAPFSGRLVVNYPCLFNSKCFEITCSVHFDPVAFSYQAKCTNSTHNMTQCSLDWWNTVPLCTLYVLYFGLIQNNKSVKMHEVSNERKPEFI